MSRKFLNGIDASSQRVVNVASPSAASDAVNKSYVDGLVNGLDWKASVRAATTAAGTLASSFANGSVIDGVTLATGDRILIKNQASGSENGIYTVNASGAPTRATDADANAEVTANLSVFVEEGTVNADTAWTLTNNGAITLGTTALTFGQVGGGTTYSAGNGLGLAGTVFSVTPNGTSIDVSSSGVKIAPAAAGAGLTEASGVLAVGAGTGVSVAADTVGIDTAVVVRKYAANIGNGALTAIPVVHNLGTRDVTVSVHDATTFEEVYPDVVKTDVNTVTLTFATAPASNAYRAIVHG